jgi:hypothetical protein
MGLSVCHFYDDTLFGIDTAFFQEKKMALNEFIK